MRVGAALLILIPVAFCQESPASTTSGFPIQPLHAQLAQASPGVSPQAGSESFATPTFIVQPGPPPVFIGEPESRRPIHPTDSRPELPDFEPPDGAAELRVDPSVEGSDDERGRGISGEKAGTEGK